MDSLVVCRTCYRQTQKYVSIFSAPELWGKNIVIAKLIMACAPVIIQIGDGLSTKICYNCLELLQLSFLFRLRVLTANERFKEVQVLGEDRSSIAPSKKLNHIYSNRYVIESSTLQKSRIIETLKQEPLDIKEEIKDTEESPSKISPASPSPRVKEKPQNQTQCNTLPQNPQNHEKNTKTSEEPQNQTQSNTLPKNPQSHEKNTNTLETPQNQTQCNTLPKNPENHENTKTLEKTQKQIQSNSLPKNPQNQVKIAKTVENNNERIILPEKTANSKQSKCLFKIYDSVNKNIITVVKPPNEEKRRTTNNSNKTNILSNESNANNSNEEGDNSIAKNLKRTYSKIDEVTPQETKIPKLNIKSIKIIKNLKTLNSNKTDMENDVKPPIRMCHKNIDSNECIIIDD